MNAFLGKKLDQFIKVYCARKFLIESINSWPKANNIHVNIIFNIN